MTTILGIFGLAFALSLALTPAARWLGMRLGAVDVPNERKIHTQPMARTGGLAIFVSFILTLIVATQWKTEVSYLFVLNSKTLCFFGGAAIAFGIGLADDFHRLRPWVKFLFQIVAANVAFFGGLKIAGIGFLTASPLSWATSYLFTVFWFVLIINAINLVDGMDGLAGGISLFASIMIILLSLLRQDYLTALFFAALGGSTMGFLRYNYNPASIFLGDGGSYFLGYAIAGLSILGGAKTQMGAILLIPALGLGVPLFDTVLAPIRRFVRGQKLFSPDRSHIHHRLREMGFSTRSVTLVLYGASLVLCLFALILVNLRNEQAGLFLIVLGGVAVLAVRKLGYFGGVTSTNVISWFKDITDVTGISHERRSFLNIQMDLSASKDLEGMWANMVRGLRMLGFDAGEMALRGTEDGGQRSEVRGQRSEGRRDGETEDAERRAEGQTEAGALRHSVASSLSHEGKGPEVRCPMSEGGALGRSVASSLSHEGKGVAGICPVCGEMHHTADGWHATWVREGFDLENDICEECLMKLELPLLREDGAFLGTLWLVKDLKREPVTHYTLRRIEHLRRTLIATLANLQSAPKSKP